MVKNTLATTDVRDTDLIPGSGRSLAEGNGNPLQYCCLENPMDRGAWQAMNIGSQRGSTCTSKIQRYKCEEKQTSPCYWLVTLMGNTLWFKKKKNQMDK